MSDAFSVLKPAGIVGVAQHKAPKIMTDKWTNGIAEYLKQTFVIAKMQVCFEFVASSGINNNPKVQLDAENIVWRLSPKYSDKLYRSAAQTSNADHWRVKPDALNIQKNQT